MKEKMGRSGPLTETDLELLGYHVVELATDENLRKVGLSPPGRGRCHLFTARAQAGIGESIHAFAYLLSDAREQDAHDLERAISSGMLAKTLGASETYVVVPNSLLGKPMLKPLGRLKVRPRAYENLMWEKIQSEVSEYMKGLQQRTEYHQKGGVYVEPSFKGAVDVPPTECYVPPTERLYHFLSGKGQEEDGVVVIRGDATLGKTTLARKVAHTLSQNWDNLKVVPVLLERETWSALAERSREQRITNLWDIVSVALEHDLHGRGPAGTLLRREDLFRRILRQGYAALIFDGFDELPKMGGMAAMSPMDNFQWLSEVASDSSARIVVTTRSAFWDREMAEGAVPANRIWDLVHFSKDNAYKYFGLFFKDKPGGAAKNKQAKKMYVGLEQGMHQQTGREFINSPVCVAMIADHVEKGGDTPQLEEKRHPVRPFLMAILNREMTRQKIQVGAGALYEAFEEIATEPGGNFTLDDIACVCAEEISEGDLLKMVDHAFIRRVGDRTPGAFEFKEDFLANHMKASYVHRLLMDLDSDPPILVSKCLGKDRGVQECIDREADGSGLLTDHLAGFLDVGDLEFLARVHGLCGNSRRILQLKSFLFHVTAKAVSSRMSGASRKDRADKVLSLLGGDKERKVVSAISVQGVVGDISIDGWKIVDSRFVDLNLTKCAGSRLHFERCRFDGGLGLARARQCEFVHCDADEQAKLTISEHNAMRVTDEDIREYLKITLGRFAHRHFRTISTDEWATGRTKGIENRFGLLGLMVRSNFAEIDRGRIKVKAFADLREFMENNRIRGSVQEIFDAMRAKAR